jgi:hypothetical protein
MIDAVFADAAAPYAVQATLSQLRYTATGNAGVADFLLSGDASSYETLHWAYVAQLLGAGGQMLSARSIDDRERRHPDVSALLARFLAHAFARGLPAALMGRDAVVDAWDPRCPLGIPEAALQPAWAHDVLRRHGWRVDARAGAATISTGWEPRLQGGILGAVGTAGNLFLGALGGDPIANLREAKTTFFAEPRGVRVLEERNGSVARDLVLEHSRICSFAVVHDVDAPEPGPARLFAFDAAAGACALPFLHRGGQGAGAEAVVALRTAIACALLGR